MKVETLGNVGAKKKERGWKGEARARFIRENRRNAFIFVSGESSTNNPTPITMVHLGRRSTYFRQIGRNGVGFSIDRTREPSPTTAKSSLEDSVSA